MGSTLNIPQYSGGGAPGGSTNQIQYNNAGAFAGSSNLTFNGTSLAFSGSGNSMATFTGTGATGNAIYAQGTNAAGQIGSYYENNRGGFASYGGLIYGGSSNAIGNFFGVSRADKMFIFADGSNNLGLGIGTLVAQPLILGTNNTAALTIDGSQNFTFAIGKFGITEGSNGRVGQVALVAGTKAITITGLTTSSRAFVSLVSPNTASLTVMYQAVCTSNTLTIQANIAAGSINSSDVSTVNYFIIN